MSNLTVVTAGTQMRHYSAFNRPTTVCGKEVVEVCEVQSHLVALESSYGGSAKLRTNVGCQRCIKYLPRSERLRLAEANRSK